MQHDRFIGLWHIFGLFCRKVLFPVCLIPVITVTGISRSAARAIYNAKNKQEATEAFNKWAKKWREVSPDAVKCIEKDIEELLNFYTCPKEIRIKVRTTNVIERAFREVRRRTRPMSCFNNSQSIERIIYAVLNHLNDKWGMKPLKEFTQKS